MTHRTEIGPVIATTIVDTENGPRKIVTHRSCSPMPEIYRIERSGLEMWIGYARPCGDRPMQPKAAREVATCLALAEALASHEAALADVDVRHAAAQLGRTVVEQRAGRWHAVFDRSGRAVALSARMRVLGSFKASRAVPTPVDASSIDLTGTHAEWLTRRNAAFAALAVRPGPVTLADVGRALDGES